MERAVRCEEEDNDDFISTEHVSLTKELQQEKSAATQELGEIVKELERQNLLKLYLEIKV